MTFYDAAGTLLAITIVNKLFINRRILMKAAILTIAFLLGSVVSSTGFAKGNMEVCLGDKAASSVSLDAKTNKQVTTQDADDKALSYTGATH